MLFRKLYIERPETSTIKSSKNWYMILRSVEDVLTYQNFDTEVLANDLLCIPDAVKRSHSASKRIYGITKLCEEYGMSPVQKLAEILDSKGKRMIEMILSGEEVLIQKSGGYSDYSGYVKIWNAVVIDEIEKDSLSFPSDIDNTIIETDLLYLENDKNINESFEKTINEQFNITGVIYKLTELKYQESDFIVGMISKAKTIAIESQFIDKDQIDKMLSIFVQLPKKRIIIQSFYTDDLKNRPLYKQCEEKHEIIYI